MLPARNLVSFMPSSPYLAKAGRADRGCFRVLLPPSVIPAAQRENAFLLDFSFSDHEQHLTGDGLSQAVGW